MTKKTWNKKPSNKLTRVISCSFVIIGLLCFLLYTWNDYIETTAVFGNKANKLSVPSQNENANQETISITDRIESRTRITTTIKPTVTTPSSPTTYNNEAQENYLKVKEQISSMRKKIEVETTSMKKSTTNSNNHVSSYSLDATSKGSFNPMKALHQILNTSPVVLFIDATSMGDELNKSNLLKNILLNNYEISPELVIVDLNKHTNGNLLQDYIKAYKLNDDDDTQLPYLFINSRSVLNKTYKQHLLEYHASNKLLNRFKKFAEGKVIFDKLELPSNS
ncbi:uncharacterized protein PWA37_001626 [Arxiozyma heterogenica]|uniref:Uncharacterized protein n=1 Tax=Arxiozyma heterogenica TaxID=278026 RepID=A0AAN8A8T4_9SACH|nr:hypothetical protein RI543_002540 [Kazachstania heterogenica]